MSAAAVARAQSASTSSSQSMILSKSEEVPDKKPTSVTTKTTNYTASSSNAEAKDTLKAPPETGPLPEDLNMILTEVARTGKCPWLSWSGKDPPETTMPPDVQAVVSSNPAKCNTRIFGKHRPTSAFSSFSSRSGGPARKKLRNGIHSSRRRYGDNGSLGSAATGTPSSAAAGRKRPLYLTRTPSMTGSTFSASSIGSGRTSGSDVEDSTHYECDSEGTSATTNSELSVERRAAQKRVIVQTSPGSATAPPVDVPVCRFKTLRGAIRSALGLVLDHLYRTRGGYKLSPAELRIHVTAVAAQSAASNAVALGESGNCGSEKENSPELELEPPSPEKTFQQRRRRLLALLGEDSDSNDAAPNSPLHHQTTGPSYLGDGTEILDGPPFTIQRIAEVLVAPERYYKQTHKLCNCLEKLLLVTSPASSFGESNGGGLSQGKGGGNEPTAMSDKKGSRQDLEWRNKRLRRRMSSSSDDESAKRKSSSPTGKADLSSSKSPGPDDQKDESNEALKSQNDEEAKQSDGSSEKISKEILEAAARAQLRSKFDHVGIDPHASSAADRGVSGIPNRGMASSPPPPGLASAAALSPHGGFARHVGEHSPGTGDTSAETVPHPSTVQQNPMPFFATANENAMSVPAMRVNQGLQMLQMHHAEALSGFSNNPLLDVVVGPDAGGNSLGGGVAAAPSAVASALSSANVANLDVEQGRSSASNSDGDSDTDDFSLDDSASDRSDGSDSGHCEPFTAARVAALNRIQQQRSMQNRAQMTLHYQHGMGFRPPLDTEYQSGDSIDSTMAEDSCGSDSSSASDLAD